MTPSQQNGAALDPTARLLRAVALTCTAAGLAFILLCGGPADVFGQEIAARYCPVLPELLAPVPAGPARAQALDQVDACPRLVAEGKATLLEVANYTVALSDSAEDGKLDIAETLVLERAFSAMETPGP
jgi:hypothetical protein